MSLRISQDGSCKVGLGPGLMLVDASAFVEPPTMFNVDFTALALGGHSQASLLSSSAVGNQAGLTFARASVSTVQTTAATMVSTGITANVAGVGCLTGDQAKRGLVMQPRTVNILGVNPRSSTGWSGGEPNGNNGWTGASSTQTNDFAAGPDGLVKATRAVTFTGTRGLPAYSPVLDPEGAYGYYVNTGGVAGPVTFTSWLNGASQMMTQDGGNPSPPSSVIGTAKLIPSAGGWARAEMRGVTIRAFTAIADGRNYTANGGGGPVAIDVLSDFVNWTRGNFSLEAIETASGVCVESYLSYPTGSQLVAANGQLRAWAKFSPMHASTETAYYGSATIDTAKGLALWAYQTVGPVESYAYVRQSDRKLVVKVGVMAEIVSTNALAWAKNDTVEIRIDVGNNVASIAKYRVNGGAWTDLVLATITNAPAPGAAPVYFFSSPFIGNAVNDNFTWPARVHRITCIAAAEPSWAV